METKEQFSKWSHIPARLLFDRNISARGKLLYALIDCMSNARGYAYARNETFLRYLSLYGQEPSERTLQRALKELTDAGYLFIENGAGGRGTLRKIYTRDVYLLNPDMGDGVNPDMGDGVINKDNNVIKKKKKKRSPRPASDEDGPVILSQEEIRDYYRAAIAHMNLSMDESTILIDLFEKFCESRAAMGKEKLIVNTRGKVDYTINRMKSFSSGDPRRMIYMLSLANNKGWETVYEIKPEQEDDFRAMFGIVKEETEEGDSEWV